MPLRLVRCQQNTATSNPLLYGMGPLLVGVTKMETLTRFGFARACRAEA